MHIHFVNYHWFDNTSGIHIFHLANEMERRGVRCTALIPDRPESVATFGAARFSVRTFRQEWWRHILHGGYCRDKDMLVHAWTPRGTVRRASQNLSARLGVPYLVHMEDNERHIYLSNRPAARNARRKWKPQSAKSLIEPRQWRSFLAGAAGFTCIVDSLLRFRPAYVPGLVFWPACEPEVFGLPTSPDLPLRRSLGIPDDALVLFYPGNAHAANLGDIASLYRAVTLLAQRGLPIWLLRAGEAGGKRGAKINRPPNMVDLGCRSANAMLPLLGAADILVQPGRPDAFNTYRFPCKLPMFLASGRPVVLPGCNIGNHLRDDDQCLITRTGSPEEMAEKIARLAADPALRLRLGANGRAFASAQLRWEIAADRLIHFYQETLATASLGRRSRKPQPPTSAIGGSPTANGSNPANS